MLGLQVRLVRRALSEPVPMVAVVCKVIKTYIYDARKRLIVIFFKVI